MSEPATDSLFEQTGGYRVGRNAWLAFNASWPFGTLHVRRGELVLYGIAGRYVFPADSIVRLSNFDGFFSSGLRIEHSIPGYPRFVVFWTRDMQELHRQLQRAGLRMAESTI